MLELPIQPQKPSPLTFCFLECRRSVGESTNWSSPRSQCKFRQHEIWHGAPHCPSAFFAIGHIKAGKPEICHAAWGNVPIVAMVRNTGDSEYRSSLSSHTKRPTTRCVTLLLSRSFRCYINLTASRPMSLLNPTRCHTIIPILPALTIIDTSRPSPH